MTRQWSWSVVLASLVLLTALMPAAAAAQPEAAAGLDHVAFRAAWTRTDQPVAAGLVQRTYYYGPEALLSCEEEYAEAPDGRRLVAYLDKARMELTEPSTGRVTTGLLAKELISGQMQVGDAAFQDFAPLELPVAGDPDAADAPTYASFAAVASIDPDQHRAAPRQGQPVTETLSRAGDVGSDAALARYGVTYADYRSELGHNVPNVFLDFFAQRGVVGTLDPDGTVVHREDLLIDWVQVMGLPVAEPYWAVVPVGGTPKWVLMQPFERRVVTYTPDNAPAFQVEMGNIGRHYLAWRHPDSTCAERQPAAPFPIPESQNAIVRPAFGPWGTVFLTAYTGFQPNEPLSLWLTTPDGQVSGTPRPLEVAHNGTIPLLPIATNEAFSSGVWAVTIQGARSGHQAIAYFGVTDRPPLPSTIEPAPASVSGAIDPAAGWPGTIFHATVAGFRHGEEVSYWLTAPNGRTYGSEERATADDSGRLETTFATHEGFATGVWSMTFQGISSGHQATVYFRIVR